MGRISVDSLHVGMVLAVDAYTFRKQLLLKAGTALTDKHIDTMRAWGVSEVEIEGHTEATVEELDARLAESPALAAAGLELDHRFAGVLHDPMMREILRIAKKQMLDKHV